MLSRAQRLTKSQDFSRVYKSGKTLRTTLFRIQTAKNNTSVSRFGVVVPNKLIKSAVGRNKKKRQIRSAIRVLQSHIIGGFDIVISPQPACVDASFEEILSDLESGFTRIGFLNER